MAKLKPYFDALGIPPTTDKKVIKKAYRKLALKYHPDHNPEPNANKMFIQIHEAYEIVSGITLRERVKGQNQEQRPSPEDVFSEKMRQAREMYEKIHEEEKALDEAYYKKYYEGWQWHGFKWGAIFLAFFNVFIIADYYLPSASKTINENDFIPNYWSEEINVGSERFHIDDPTFWKDEYPPIEIHKSYFFKDIKAISYLPNYLPLKRKKHPANKMQETELFKNHKTTTSFAKHSIYSLFPTMNIIIMIPLLMIIFKRIGFWYNILRIFSIYVIFTYGFVISIVSGRILKLFSEWFD